MSKETFNLTFPYANKFANKEKVNIKFYAGMIPNVYWNNNLWINPSSWFIKCYYDLNGNYPNRLDWKTPQLNDANLNVEDFLKVIEEEDIDIVCLGLYLWNHSRYNELGNEIKKRRPHTIILAGGPEVDVHKNAKQFWETHDFVDIVVYGDGEEAFTTIIDAMFDINNVKQTPCNFVYREKDQSIDVGYRRFNDPEYKIVSPYLNNKEDITKTINEIRAKSNVNLLLNWELTRGCPFQCSFCDWSSGLHHKTYRKTYDYNADLNFFKSIDLVVNWIDANVGIYKEDISIVDKSLELNKENSKFKLRISNYSKVKKDVVYSLIEKIELHHPGKEVHVIAIQDINEEVLKNISRPDIPWVDHKKIISEIKQRNPQIKFLIETIIGLPGQTIDSYSDMLIEFSNLNINLVEGSLFNFLPNSPAANIEYQEKYKLKFNTLGYMHTVPKDIKTLNQLKDNLHNSSWTKSNFITQTFSSSFADHLAMIGMAYFYCQYFTLYKLHNWPLNSKKFSKILKSSKWKEFGEMHSQRIWNNSSIFGFPMIVLDSGNKIQSFFQYFEDKKNWLYFIQ